MTKDEMEAEIERLKAAPEKEREDAVAEALEAIHNLLLDASQAAHLVALLCKSPEVSCYSMILGYLHQTLHRDPFRRNAAMEDMAHRAAVSLGLRPAVVDETPAQPTPETVH